MREGSYGSSLAQGGHTSCPRLTWICVACPALTGPSGASLPGGSLLQSSAPVNIPGSLGSSASFHSASPSPPVSLSSHFLQQPQGHLSQSENTFLGTSASHGSLGKRGYVSPGQQGLGFWKVLLATLSTARGSAEVVVGAGTLSS